MRLHTLWVVDHVVISVHEHFHNYYQLMICLGGSGEITVGNNRYRMSRGDVCLAEPMERHSLVQDDGMRLVEVKFVVLDRNLDENIRKMPEHFTIDSASIFERIERLSSAFYMTGIYSSEIIDYELFLLLAHLMRDSAEKYEIRYTEKTDSVAIPHSDASAELETRFDRIVEYIEHNISEPITLDTLADAVHFDKSYLTVKFKEIYGLSPMRYVAHTRLERAKALLSSTDKSVTEVAHETGFSSIHYFSRHFKAKVGFTPGEYRGGRRLRERLRLENSKCEPTADESGTT